jgi:succinoglycan biosynthesis protein ExoA
MGRRLGVRSRLWLPIVVATMHLTWGWGFLRSIPRRQRRGRHAR